MKTQNVVVDIGNLKASDIFFVQGERGREITFKVINSLLEDFVNLAGYTATIHILKSDGNFTIDSMTIDSSKSECYYTLTENDCACGGRGFYDLSFSKNDELIYTAHGDFVGDFRSVNDDSVNSVSSAYGVTFPEGFQQKLIAGDKIHISENNVISAEGETYTAGDNINISEQNVISASVSDIYSNTERKVGKWITGEDVYEIIIGNESTPVSDFYDLSSLNIKTIIDINAISCDSASGIANSVNMTMESMLAYAASNLLNYDRNSKLLRVINWSGYYMYCIKIRYTKGV